MISTLPLNWICVAVLQLTMTINPQTNRLRAPDPYLLPLLKDIRQPKFLPDATPRTRSETHSDLYSSGRPSTSKLIDTDSGSILSGVYEATNQESHLINAARKDASHAVGIFHPFVYDAAN